MPGSPCSAPRSAELDVLLRERKAATDRTRLFAMIALALAVLVVVAAAVGLRPAWSAADDRADDWDGSDADPGAGAGAAEPQGGELVGAGHEGRGGTRAAR